MSMLRRLILLNALLVALCCARWSLGKDAAPRPPVGVSIPLTMGGWQGTDLHTVNDPPLEEIGVDWRLLRGYRRRGARAELLIEYNHPGSGHAHTPEHCVRGNGWRWQTSRVEQLSIGSQRTPLPVTTAIMENDERRAALLYWYQSGDTVFASYFGQKIADFFRVVRLRPAAPKISVRIIATEPEAPDARLKETAREFAALVASRLNSRASLKEGHS